MTHFGTVESFDEAKGYGLIKPETAGTSIGFERSAISWENKTPPVIGKRLSYELSDSNGQTSAVNLQNA
jgi:cold shock CspA family protein